MLKTTANSPDIVSTIFFGLIFETVKKLFNSKTKNKVAFISP